MSPKRPAAFVLDLVSGSPCSASVRYESRTCAVTTGETSRVGRRRQSQATVHANRQAFFGASLKFVSAGVNIQQAARHAVIQATVDTGIPVEPRPIRLIQHKKEAFWFYRFLSLIYDDFINPFHWTEEMRDESLKIAHLENVPSNAVVVDVGGGTGFCTQGVVKYVRPEQVTILDQSPHQLAQAKKKPELAACTKVEGDAEDLPFETDSCDRYTSAGSIEYWPEPQRGIAEAYRVLKPGGFATIIGPVRPTNPFSKFWADLWMLFPTEEEYIRWYKAAGFTDIQIKYITPKAYRGIRSHGLIMGLTICGRKPVAGLPKIKLGPKSETTVQEGDADTSLVSKLLFLPRFLLGVAAGAYYAILPLFVIAYARLFLKESPVYEVKNIS
eukprot:CAMPEP_0196653402 /NCGR_PEP_ID=MMETSP1086-20130531/3022_1 /TAXON_ID=77921 /ORGANISM="Cyanoptyche  gloeocystis , Strain SAG4.97" /LENGTH=384 /DNA_ID=CAMNT_0041984581 /DNA_START=87 /DNA_END=1241 /DNA_ORIENTATION=-